MQNSHFLHVYAGTAEGTLDGDLFYSRFANPLGCFPPVRFFNSIIAYKSVSEMGRGQRYTGQPRHQREQSHYTAAAVQGIVRLDLGISKASPQSLVVLS